jgi:hypothetical protein
LESDIDPNLESDIDPNLESDIDPNFYYLPFASFCL